MKSGDQNPKAESRKPKEGRTPKAEPTGLSELLREDPAFWSWGEEIGAGSFALREDHGFASAPVRDLMERTARFGEAIIAFARKIPRGPVTNRLIDQLVGAGTSVAANYCEADDSVSCKDFKKSIGTCRKESKETMLFLRLIAKAEESLAAEARGLWREAKELNLIFGAIWRK
jgi:four helix bundle protein